VVSVFIPVAIDQGYFRYNAWILPTLGLAVALLYTGMALTSRPVKDRWGALHVKFKHAKPIAYWSITISLGIVIIVLLAIGSLFSFRLSREHVAYLRSKDTPSISPLGQSSITAKTVSPPTPSAPQSPSLPSSVPTSSHRSETHEAKSPAIGSTKTQDHHNVSQAYGVQTIAPGGTGYQANGPNAHAGPIIVNPEPEIIASSQRQQQTGDPNQPWITTFSIRSTGAVITGDLKLTCTGPVIRAGIGRINPFAFSSGSNGPDPKDPNTAVYELSPEPLAPGKQVSVAVYSGTPIYVLSGFLGANKLHFVSAESGGIEPHP